MCFHSYMCKDLARSSHPPQAMLAPRRHTLFLSFAAHSLHPPSPLSSHVKDNGDTALIKASANGRTAAVELLLAAGADKVAKSKVRD